jgi:hypothetical protein
MRAVRFTKAEATLLRSMLEFGSAWQTPKERVTNAEIVRKLDDAEGTAEVPGVSGAAIEAALVKTARGKVVPLASGGAGYARASKQATQVDATVEDAELLGAWLARQGWMRDPCTVLLVLNKWVEWLPRARATAPPPEAKEGFNGPGESGKGPTGPSGRGGGGRQSPGFR